MEVNQNYKIKSLETINLIESPTNSPEMYKNNNIQMSYYFPGNSSLDDKENTNFINFNNLNEVFCNIKLISKNKKEPSLQVEAKNDISNSNHHSFSELTFHTNKEKNMQSFKATFKDDNNDSELIQNSNKTIKYETSTIIKGPQTLNYLQLPRFFVIKSVDEENIHKSIKFRIWCSTYKGNEKLQKAFKEADNNVNGSGKFIGLAQMTSEVDYNANFNLWSQGDKWKGFFFVIWLIIKDVPNKAFRHINNQYNDGKLVTSSRDTQEIYPQAGMEVLKIFKEYAYESSIIDEINVIDNSHYELFDNHSQTEINSLNIRINNNKPIIRMNINSKEYIPNKQNNLSYNSIK